MAIEHSLIPNDGLHAPKDDSVTAAKIQTDAVETAKIKDGAVTAPKIAAGGAANKYLTSDGTTPSWAEVDVHKTGWSDMFGPFIAGKPGTSPPSWNAWGAGGLYAYSFAVGNTLFLAFHIQHDYKIGTTFYPHVHWAPSVGMTAGQQVAWRITWMAARGHQQEAFTPASPGTLDLVYTSVGTTAVDLHMVTEVADPGITVPNAEPDIIVMAKVERIATTDTTYDATPVWGLMLDAHYQVDRHATLNRAPDFYT